MKRLFSEATLHGIAEVHTCTSIVVLTYCRMAIRIYFNREAKKQTTKSAMKRIYKSIVIHLLKDSNQ
jgi:hypothetical protein